MNITQRMLPLAFAGLCLAAGGTAQAPAQGQPGAASPSVWAAPPAPQAGQASSAFQSACGNQPMCYDASDFAVAVVDFRMSVTNGWKVMDATLRFVNKTNQPLILGYVDTSAMALDDQGNRYAPYGNRNLAGIGIVSGNSGDPKFQLAPGGAGDARWELIWHPGAQDPVGSTFELDLTIREMNTLTGGAHTLGAEVPLRFQGLANGMTGAAGGGYSGAAAGAPGAVGVAGAAAASPMLASGSSGLPPCPPAGANGAVNAVAGAANSVGGQQTAAATSTATNTATGAAAAFSNLKSLFGKKNASAPATNAAGAAPCIPAATGAAMPVAAGTSTAPAAAGQFAGAAPAAATAPAGKTAATTVTPGKVPAAATNSTAGKAPAVSNAAKTAPTVPAGATTATKPAAVLNTAASSAKPAMQPASAAAPKPATPGAPQKPATQTQPANKKPAPTTTTPPKTTNQ